MILTNIVVPTGCTTCRTSNSIIDTILKTHRTNAFETVVCNHIITEYVKVFLNHWTKVFTELLRIFYEVRIDIILNATYSIIVLNQAATRCFLHHVEHVLTITHTIEECCKCTHILSSCTKEQQVVVDTLELIHNCTDILDTF